MKKVLLIAAIYSLIINQCCKNGQKSLFNREGKEKIAGMGVLLGKFYYSYVVPGNWRYKYAGLVTGNNRNHGTFSKESGKEKP
jgi:hypothetical protein